MKKIVNSKIFRIISGLIKFVIFAAVILYVAFLAAQRISNNSSIMGYRVFTIATGSMEPEYVVGDVLLVKEVDFESLEVGDDVTYLGSSGDFADKIVTHRIIEINIEENTIKTQGIANDTADPTITSDQVYGKVTYRFIFFSFLTKLLKNKYGFYFLIFIPLVLVIFLEIADIFVKDKDDENEETSE